MDSALLVCTQGLITSSQAKTNSTPKTDKKVLSFHCIPNGGKKGVRKVCSRKSLISFQHFVFKTQWLLKTLLVYDLWALTNRLQYLGFNLLSLHTWVSLFLIKKEDKPYTFVYFKRKIGSRTCPRNLRTSDILNFCSSLLGWASVTSRCDLTLKKLDHCIIPFWHFPRNQIYKTG